MTYDIEWTEYKARLFQESLCATCAHLFNADNNTSFSLPVTQNFARWLNVPLVVARSWTAYKELPTFEDYTTLIKRHPELALPRQYEEDETWPEQSNPYDRIKEVILELIGKVEGSVAPQDLATALKKAVTEDALKTAIEGALCGFAGGPQG